MVLHRSESILYDVAWSFHCLKTIIQNSRALANATRHNIKKISPHFVSKEQPFKTRGCGWYIVPEAQIEAARGFQLERAIDLS